MSVLVKGQRWEFVNVTRQTVTEYELEWFNDVDVKGRYCTLRNMETEGEARITCQWLQEGRRRAGSYWREVEPKHDTLEAA